MLRNGANLRDVQQFLGHADIATTSKYLHSNEEQLRSISELTGIKPKEQDTIKDQRLSQGEQGKSRLRRRAV